MIKNFVPAVALAAAIFVPVAPAFSQQQSPQAQIAGLSEDVAALRSEVARLRTELDELRAENARLLEIAEQKVKPADEITPKIAALRAELKEFIAVQQRTATAETDAKLKRLADMVNRAVDDLSKNLNRVAAAVAAANAAAPATIAKPDDFPNGGIEYTVKPGDTLGKIISKNGSKKSWILYANPEVDPDKIFPGQKIFVPQQD